MCYVIALLFPHLLPFFLLFKALYYARGLPFKEGWPDEITAPSFSIMQPTDGFFLVDPKFIFACSNARNKKCKLLDLKLFFRFTI